MEMRVEARWEGTNAVVGQGDASKTQEMASGTKKRDSSPSSRPYGFCLHHPSSQ